MKKISWMAAFAVVVPMVAWSGDRPAIMPATGLLGHWDTNDDGMVTRDEAQMAASERAGKRFDALDQDKDGVLTREELDALMASRRAAAAQRMGERFKAADLDGDGGLSREEAEKAMPWLSGNFDRLDRNQDGQLSQNELRSRKKMRRR